MSRSEMIFAKLGTEYNFNCLTSNKNYNENKGCILGDFV